MMPLGKSIDDSIRKAVRGHNPRLTREQLMASGNHVCPFKLAKQVGHTYMHISEKSIRVWALAKESPGYRELSRDDLAGGNSGLRIVGFGDPETNAFYGAGPTRDLRRATLSARLAVTLEDQELINGGLFPKSGDFAFELSDNLIRNFKINCQIGVRTINSDYNGGAILSVGELALTGSGYTTYLDVWVTNMSAERKLIGPKPIHGDVVLLLTQGSVSGHEFIPESACRTSPFHGGLASVVTNVSEIYGGLGRWTREQTDVLIKVAQALVPNKRKTETPMLTIYNT